MRIYEDICPSLKTEQEVADIARAMLDALKAAGGNRYFDRMRVFGHMLDVLTDGEGIGTVTYQRALGSYFALKLEPLIPAVRAFQAHLVAGGYSKTRPLDLSTGTAAERVYVPHGDYVYPVIDSAELRGFVMTPIRPETNYIVVVDDASTESEGPRLHLRRFWNELPENLDGEAYTGHVFGRQTTFSREDVIRLADAASWYSDYSYGSNDHPNRPSLGYFEQHGFRLRQTNSGYLASTTGKANPDGHEVEAPADVPQTLVLMLLDDLERTLRRFVPEACLEEHPCLRAQRPLERPAG